MQCPRCQHENPPGAKFCVECASPIVPRCSACGSEVPPTAKFCPQCAASLATAAMPPVAPHPRSSAPRPASAGIETAERRQLTVLFCDLVGSTELAAHTDPEEWRTVLVKYHQTARDVIDRFDGHVAKNLGDGFLAYFGWPAAHEDDAERAARAALATIERIKELEVAGLGNERSALSSNPTNVETLSARVGIATGPVVIADNGEIYGDTANIAARVQALARPDTVMVTAATHRLVSGLFIVEEHGAQPLKGIPEPVALYRIVRPSGVRSRLAAAAAARALTPFVGRPEERRLLRDRFELARDGAGQVVLLVGEAGIGKSRLAQVLHDDLADIPHTWLEAGGQPYFADTPFYAITELLKQFFAWSAEDSNTARAEALANALEATGLDPKVALPLIAPLLDLPLPEHYPPVMAAPEVARKRLVGTLAAWTIANARLQPLVILLEDLQWIDSSTLELLQLLADQSATTPLLLLLTTRPEFRAPWTLRAHHTQITLNRLPPQYTRLLVQAVASRAALPAEMIDAVIARTDGVPLFAEELAKTAIEAGTKAVAAIPTTLADSLMARLDRLGPSAKEVAQIAAVIGREFSYALITTVAAAVHEPALNEEEVEEALAMLVDAELVYVRGMAPGAAYSFKHALVQDAAYGSLLTSRRRVLHGQIARLLSAEFPAIAEAQPELLAHHYAQAGEAEPAIDAWQRAAERAFKSGAASAAEAYVRQGLALVEGLPESPARDQREFGLQLLLAQAIQITKGYASAELEAPLSRVRALGSDIHDPDRWALSLVTLWGMVMSGNGPLAARPFADEALLAAEDAGSAVKAWAHFPQVSMNFYSGNFIGVRDYASRALALYDEASPVMMLDTRVVCITYLAMAEFHLGYADRARRLMAEGVAHAERTGRAIDRAWAEMFSMTLFCWVGDYAAMEEHLARVLAACAEGANIVHEAVSEVSSGWAMAKQGDAESGIARMRSGLNKLHAAGSRLDGEQCLDYIADALERLGRFDEALAVLSDAEDACPGDVNYRAETLRLRAKALAHTGAADADVEATFRASLDHARRQEAKMFELLTSASYARWLRDHGRAAEARELLEPVYAWFTEGFDMRELKDAKALLEQLAG